ncbi:hypothetical protein BFU36_08840 [Sulfolobus sp. A20]|uniref:archaellin/type IV pilin N-terminal domain-containing protein n=1 Tax=Saccharolobus sp. A20 TaxID=1891280 RepID=UPI000845DFA9|nr:archaellin/type IV pilin N-terminal domain-containing protein [Sulfolobus sp. A20]TRM79622.1 hypothetical protein DJ528_00015 [Sulfolobus sp. B5]TRM85639.1 hypothetical protein DJ521_07440 [Sulfolobus sp. E3]TRM89373.1 hypothetical protein DJ529_02570 [Sulfolobus sp. C3]TRN01147.1 hypothetical protein DJ530_06415 [Sulfolobus sp. E1]TRN04671.1 hypothetical protein DJ527_00160 [Sulfolobus sp. F1]
MNKGISEAITVVFLILITLVAVAIVSIYYLHVVSLHQLSLSEELSNQYKDIGQLLTVVYYYQKGGCSYFFVENIGNVPINVTQIYLNSTQVSSSTHLSYVIYNSTNTKINVLYPQLVYVILVHANVTSIIIRTSNDNLIQLVA